MAQITLKGNPFSTSGNLPTIGQKAATFELIKNDLSTVSLADFLGKKIILNIFPSIDTGTCATSVRTFNKKVADLNNTVVLCISRDLPFAQSRFCGTEGIENAITLSDFNTGKFGADYGLTIVDGPLKGLLSRSIVVLDEKGTVIHTEQVTETVDEPNYDAALATL